DVALLGVPTFATSISPTGAHATPAAVRRALGRLSTWSALRRMDIGELTALDLGDVADPDLPDGDWRVRTVAQTAVAKARLVAILGGDNSATLHGMAGVCHDSLGTTAGLITLDAHHDIREGRSN